MPLTGRKANIHTTEQHVVCRFATKPAPITISLLQSRCGLTRRNGSGSKEWYGDYSPELLSRVCEFTGHPVNKIPIMLLEQFLSCPPSVADTHKFITDATGITYLFVWYVSGDRPAIVKSLKLDIKDCIQTVYFWDRMYQVFEVPNWEEDVA